MAHSENISYVRFNNVKEEKRGISSSPSILSKENGNLPYPNSTQKKYDSSSFYHTPFATMHGLPYLSNPDTVAACSESGRSLLHPSPATIGYSDGAASSGGTETIPNQTPSDPTESTTNTGSSGLTGKLL